MDEIIHINYEYNFFFSQIPICVCALAPRRPAHTNQIQKEKEKRNVKWKMIANYSVFSFIHLIFLLPRLSHGHRAREKKDMK